MSDANRDDLLFLDYSQLYDRLVKTLPEFIYILDLSRMCHVYRNRDIGDFLGYTPQQMTAMGSQAMPRVMHPDDLPRIMAHLEKVRSSGDSRVHEIEYRMKHADGEWRYFHSRDTVFARDPAGRPTQILGVATDITARRRTQEELHRQRDFAASLIQTAPAIVVALDVQGHVTLFNSFGQELTGYTEQDVLGRNWFDIFIPPSMRDTIQSVFRTSLNDRRVHGYENPILDKNGREIWIRWFDSPLKDRDGKTIGLMAIGQDVTEIRSKELQLRQAQKMEAVGRLAGGFAHDFNNQLTVIKGYCDLLLNQLPPEDRARESVNEVRRAAERAEGLTGMLLSFSRRQILRPVVASLNTVVLDMANPLRRLIGNDIDLTLRLDPRLGNVRVDPNQFQQAVMNLVINARDAMPAGGKLTLETASVDVDAASACRQADLPPGPYVLFTLSDTGVGMSAEAQKHVFEPFFTTKPVGQGTGLGLSMVYGFVKQSGGHISFHSEADRGTTFRIYLPRVDEEAEKPAAAAAEGELSRGDESVLVVENDGAVRQLVVRVLADCGYAVREAADPDRALALIEETQGGFDIVVTDVVMPHMNGPELVRRLTLHDPGIKALYISGYTQDAMMHQGAIDPGVNLLVKPFSPDALSRAVRRILDHAEGKM